MRHTLLALTLTAALAMPALAQTPPAPPEAERMIAGQRDGYLVDSQNGCWVWTGGISRSSTDLAVRWSGSCPEGPATGRGRAITSWREAGQLREMVFEGTLQRGKAEGYGTLAHLEDGEAVVLESGEYRNDYLVQGRLEIPRNNLVYEGGLMRGQPHGEGQLTVQGRQFRGTWQNGCLEVSPGDYLAFTRPADSCAAAPT